MQETTLSSGHYKHHKVAEYFDVTEQYEKDISFYKEMLAENNRLLELGVGTGRVAVELAKEGAHITGIDFSRAMLDRARQRLEEADLAGSVELVEADMRDFDLQFKSFDMAYIPYYSFGYIYNLADQSRCLKAVHDHLQTGGLLIVHMFQPNPAYFGSLALGGIGGSVVEDGGIFSLPSGNQLLVTLRTSHDRANQKLHSNVIFEEILPNGEPIKYVIPLTTHLYYRYELELLLKANGFETLEVYGDFDRSELKQDSWEMIFVARSG